MYIALARLELLQILRSRSVVFAMTAWLCMGIAAAAIGALRVERERAALADREAFLHEQHRFLSERHADDLGLFVYYLALPTEHAPNAWTALAAGLRDVFPFSQHLRLLSLAPQLHAGELGSPLQQLTGHFDYAFVVVFLLPLLAIAVCYDLQSRDTELGVDALVRSQPLRASTLSALRLGVRTAFVLGFAWLLFACVLALAKLPLDARAGLWLIGCTSYAIFWAALAWIVSSYRRSSSWNALTLIGCWIFACVLLPAAANVALMRPPTESALAFTLEQRELLNAGWDRPKQAALDAFTQRHAQWAAVRVPEDQFSWPWYYANQELADLAVDDHLHEYRQQLTAQETRTHWLATFLPPLALARALNSLAGTDLSAAFDYQDSLAEYHRALKATIYPLVFDDKRATDLRLEQLPRHRFRPEPTFGDGIEAAGLVAMTLLLLSFALIRARAFDRPNQSAGLG